MKRNTALLTGSIAYITLLILSIIYYEQRTVIFDMSFQLFSVLKDNSFAIQINRFGAVVTQIFPLMASRAGLSLNNVALIYSTAFVIYYFAVFLFILLVLKNTKTALVLLLFNTMIVTHSFFWIQCELLQGIAFTLLFIAFVENQLKSGKVSLLFQAFSPLFLFTIVFFYPLLPFVLLFALAYLSQHYQSQKKSLLSIGVSYIFLYLVKILFFKTAYDSTSMNGVKNFITKFPNYFNLQSNKSFMEWLIKDYYAIIIFSAIVIAFYLWKRNFIKLLLFAGSSLFLVLLINVCYFYGQDQFYLEPQYSILPIFISYPLVYDIFPKFKSKKIPVFIVASVVLLSFIRIINTARLYTERLNWDKNILKSTTGKIILKEKDVPMNLLKLSWGSSYEFWLLSTMENKQSRSIIIEQTTGEFDAENNRKSFITKYGAFDYNQLNKKYFIFNDTVSQYIKK